MIIGVLQPSLFKQDASFQKIPFGIARGGRNPVQQHLRVHNPAGAHHAADIGEAGAARGGTAAGLPASPLLTHPDNGIVSFVDFLHLFLRQIRQRVVGVIVRVIFTRHFPISGFNLLVGGLRRNLQYFIRIVHAHQGSFSFSGFLWGPSRVSASFWAAGIPNSNILRKMPSKRRT